MKYLVLIAIIAGLIWFYLSRSAPGKKSKKRVTQTKRESEPDQPSKASEFHGVEIKTKDSACAAVKELKGYRFLAHSSPNLPLPQCDADKCECAYSHFDDRRDSEGDRRAYGAAQAIYSNSGQDERRTTTGRRDTDDSNEKN